MSQTKDTMEKRQETLRQYVSDMQATEKHIHEAVTRQTDDESVKQQPEASRLINRLHQTLDTHINTLESHNKMLDGSSSSIKDAITTTLGAMAGLYDKVRTKQVSRMLRDDYTALSLAAISYTMLHTTALGLNDQHTADIALRHLKDLTPLITEISRIMPQVVALELTEDHPNLNVSSAPESMRRTQEAWDAKHVNQPAMA